MNYFKKKVYSEFIPFIGKLMVGRNRFVNVIYYHDIVPGTGRSFMRTNIDVFRSQMRYIVENGYKTLRFDELDDETNLRFEKKKVVIAFDDGWLSNYTMIFDLMSSLGIKYNIYLTIGKIGNHPDYLTWDLVRKMHDSALVGFGVHTYTHPHVADMSEIDPVMEFGLSNDVFRRELGYEPLDFCYPYGSCSEKAHEYLTTNTNYRRIYTSGMMYSYEKTEELFLAVTESAMTSLCLYSWQNLMAIIMCWDL